MKSKLLLGALLAVVTILNVSGQFAVAAGTELVIADFNTGDKPSNIGGDFGTWNKDADDETQGATMSFVSEDALGDPSGYAVRLDYDVDSPNPAYNGFWMKLNNTDATAYNSLTFYVKGDSKTGYTKRVKVELKDKSGKPCSYVTATTVTDEWQRVSISFDKFRRLTDWTGLSEFVIVFDDVNSRPEKGTIIIDQISFSRE